MDTFLIISRRQQEFNVRSARKVNGLIPSSLTSELNLRVMLASKLAKEGQTTMADCYSQDDVQLNMYSYLIWIVSHNLMILYRSVQWLQVRVHNDSEVMKIDVIILIIVLITKIIQEYLPEKNLGYITYLSTVLPIILPSLLVVKLIQSVSYCDIQR